MPIWSKKKKKKNLLVHGSEMGPPQSRIIVDDPIAKFSHFNSRF